MRFFDPGDATPLARYLDGLYARQVVTAVRTHGAGQVVDAGARGAACLTAVLDDVLDLADVRSLLTARDGDGRQPFFYYIE